MTLIRGLAVGLVVGLSACIGSSSNNTVKPGIEVAGTVVFPTVTAADLDGNDYQLPKDFSTEYTVLLFGFAHEQKELLKEWMPALGALKNQFMDLSVIKMPVIDPANLALRTIIRNGMRSSADEESRRQTLTLFVDRKSFADALKIKDINTVALVLVDKHGRVHWRETGPVSPEKSDSLKAILDGLSKLA